MTDMDAIALKPHLGLSAAMSAWANLSDKDKYAWDGQDCRDALRAAIAPALHGYGVARIPLLDRLDDHGVEYLQHLLLALSQQIGYVLPQTHENNLIGQIQDEGIDYRVPTSRGHKTNSELNFHSDRSDLNFLLYVRPAQVGGELSVVSFDAATRLLAVRAPDALEVLQRNFPFDLRDERIFHDREWCLHPILWRRGKEMRGHYIRRFILDSQRHATCPRLTEAQHSALSTFEALLDELRVGLTFKPSAGELLVLNNYRVLHARTSFCDSGQSGLGRLALRTWVAPYDSEELPEFMRPISGAVTAGSFRGGVGKGDTYLSLLGSTFQQLIDGPML